MPGIPSRSEINKLNHDEHGIAKRHVCGIDPGKTGGYAIFRSMGDLVTAGPLEFDKPENLYNDLTRFAVREIVIERAQAAAGDAGQFEYGRSFGRTEAACLISGARVWYCAPQWWKARLSVSTDKAKAYAQAIEEFPALEFFAPPGPRGGLDKVHGIAEAALLGSILTARRASLYAELTKNNAARTAKAGRRKNKPRYDWRGD